MALKVYGNPQSRALRALWMAEELGIGFERVPVDFGAESKQPEFLAINPNGRVPAIDDNGFRLWESMAINLYLAKKYGGDLAPRDLQEDAIATQWSFWVMTEVEKTLLQALFHATGMMGAEKSAEKCDACLEQLQPAFRVLDAALAGREYLTGERFTVADLNVASVLLWSRIAGADLSGYSNLAAWFARCIERPALARANGKK